MKTKAQLIEEIKASKAEYIYIGLMDEAMTKEDAIAQIEACDEEEIGSGDWEEAQ